MAEETVIKLPPFAMSDEKEAVVVVIFEAVKEEIDALSVANTRAKEEVVDTREGRERKPSVPKPMIVEFNSGFSMSP